MLSVEEERGEREVDSGLRFTADEAVVVRVKRRLHRYMVDDRGAAARIAGRPPGWRELAHEVVVREHGLNVDRQGQVFVPTVRPALLDELVLRVAGASLGLYVALLELQD